MSNRTCYACGVVAVGFRWFYGGYYFACQQHRGREPVQGVDPELMREAVARLHGESKL